VTENVYVVRENIHVVDGCPGYLSVATRLSTAEEGEPQNTLHAEQTY